MRMYRVLLVFVFVVTAMTATFGIWNGLVYQGRMEISLIKPSVAADPVKAPKSGTSEPAPAAAPSPPPVATSAQTPALAPLSKGSTAAEGKQKTGGAPTFEPLDLTPAQVALLEQAHAYGQAVRRREETLAMRERALEVARLELERRLELAKKTLEQASASQRAAVEAELEDKRRELQALQSEVSQREESLKALAAKIREDASQKTEKTIAAYRSMKPKKVAAVLSQMDAVEAATVLYLLPDEQRAKIVSELDPAVAGALLRTPFASEFAKLATASR